MLKEDEVDKNNKYTTMNDDFVYIQSSLLYSYGDGSRRIRIHNLCLPVSNNIFDIVNSIDSEAEISVFLKRTIDQIYRQHNLSNAIDRDLREFDPNVGNSITFEQFLRWISIDHTIYIQYGNKNIMIATSLIRLDDIYYDENSIGGSNGPYPSF